MFDDGPLSSTPVGVAPQPRAGSFGLVECRGRSWRELLRQTSWDLHDTFQVMVLVQPVGGPLPAWATPKDNLPEWPTTCPWSTIEVLVVREPESLARHLGEVEANRLFYPPNQHEAWRVAVVPEAQAALFRHVADTLGADMVVTASPDRIDMVAGTLAAIFTSDLYIGLDLMDVRTGATYGTRGYGQAFVMDGIVDEADVAAAATWLGAVRGGKPEGGGVLVVQSIAQREHDELPEGFPIVNTFDGFITLLNEQCDPDCMAVTIAQGGPSTGLMMVAFV